MSGSHTFKVRETYGLTNYELAILLTHLFAANSLPEEIGFEDAERSIEYIRYICSRKRNSIDRPILESLLWSANLMDEAGYFWHPEGLSFEEFANSLLYKDAPRDFKDRRPVYFDRFYNLIMNSKEEEE